MAKKLQFSFQMIIHSTSDTEKQQEKKINLKVFDFLFSSIHHASKKRSCSNIIPISRKIRNSKNETKQFQVLSIVRKENV